MYQGPYSNSSGSFPSDVQHAGLTEPGIFVKYLNEDGSVKEKQVMLGDVSETEGVGTWIPRHSFNEVLCSHIQAKHADTVKVQPPVLGNCKSVVAFAQLRVCGYPL